MECAIAALCGFGVGLEWGLWFGVHHSGAFGCKEPVLVLSSPSSSPLFCVSLQDINLYSPRSRINSLDPAISHPPHIL